MVVVKSLPWLVAVLLVATVADCLRWSEEYLNGPELVPKGVESHRMEVLKKVSLRGATSVEQVAERLEWYLNRVTGAAGSGARAGLYDERDREPLEDWLGVSRMDGRCDGKSAKFFVDAFHDLEKSTAVENKQLLVDYMLKYGTEKFDKCAREAMKMIEATSEAHSEELAEVDLFFRKLVFLDEKAPDSAVYEAYKSRRVTDAIWNVDYLKTLIAEADFSSDSRTNYRLLFTKKCIPVEDYFRVPLTSINLATALKPDQDYFGGNYNAMKLNEINRICLDMWRYVWYKNLQRQM